MAQIQTTWSGFAQSLLPGLRYIHQHGGLAAWVPLAMAARESGVPTAADSTYVNANNPWGIRCFQSQYPCSADDFQVYPTLYDSSVSFVAAVGPVRMAYAGQPLAFLQQLQASGWSGPGAQSAGYADLIFYTWGPPAQNALAALGVDIVTGLPLESAPPPGSPPGFIPPIVPAPAYGMAALLAGMAAGIGGALAVVLLSGRGGRM